MPTLENYDFQWERLVTRFGSRAMDKEFGFLVNAVVKGMSDNFFRELINRFIESRKHNNPPLMVDFREAVKKHNQKKFNDSTKFDYLKKMDTQEGRKWFNKLGAKNPLQAMDFLIARTKKNLAEGKLEYEGIEEFDPESWCGDDASKPLGF